MKQILQSFKTGKTFLEEIPVPRVQQGSLLIETTHSLVSIGTEKMLVEFGKANLVSKAIQQPERVGQVLDKIKTEGLVPTLEAVFNKLEQPIPLGYCNVGKVIAVGEGVKGFAVGDRVASNGPHAEFVSVPYNLAAHIPDNVTDEEATFTVIGSIGLQGIRLLNPTLGETVVVIGLGLVGLVTAQLLLANGCRVIGIDLDENRLQLAQHWGIIPVYVSRGDVVSMVKQHTHDVGADGVIIAASAKSDEIIAQAAGMSRKRGRIVLVGVVGLDIQRSDFYEKELTFQVSCSYGPGRYDETYEQKGQDYPLPYVRWTAQRNFDAVLQCLSSGQLKVKDMITEVIPLESFGRIYDHIEQHQSLGSILRYAEHKPHQGHVISISPRTTSKGKGVIGIIGAGNFTKMTMLPALKQAGGELKYISSAKGLTAVALAKKFHIAHATTDYHEILKDPGVELVMITTRHDLHSGMVIESLKAGKHVFVEKPLAIRKEELKDIIAAYENCGTTLYVGFNRRYSPHAQKLKTVFGHAPMNVIVTVNAGAIPADSWVHDMNIGGGRIIGEACHFMDLISFFTESRITSVCMNAMEKHPSENTDNASILLQYENGSTGTIHYFSNGSKKYSKERIEVYSLGRTAVIDNWRITRGYGCSGFSKLKTALDKGHAQQFAVILKSIQSGSPAPIPFESLVNTTEAGFAAIESLQKQSWVQVDL